LVTSAADASVKGDSVLDVLPRTRLPAFDARLAAAVFEAGFADAFPDAGLGAEAFKAGFAEAFKEGFAEAFKAGFADAFLDAGLAAEAFETGFADAFGSRLGPCRGKSAPSRARPTSSRSCDTCRRASENLAQVGT
jgi:hypothetical protein